MVLWGIVFQVFVEGKTPVQKHFLASKSIASSTAGWKVALFVLEELNVAKNRSTVQKISLDLRNQILCNNAMDSLKKFITTCTL